MTSHRFGIGALIVLGLCSVALAQPAGPPPVNWTAPPYWTPPAATEPELAVRAASAKTSKTVRVDCGRHESINAALTSNPKAVNLVVEISGMCNENVVVTRDRVTLRGANPATDGIRAVAAIETTDAAVWVRDAQLVTIENLTLTGGQSGLVATNASEPFLWVRGCRLEGNASYGVRLETNSLVEMEDTVLTSNGFFNGAVFAASNLRLTRCTLSNVQSTPTANLLVYGGGSYLLMNATTLTNGGIVSNNALLLISDSTIHAPPNSPSMQANGQTFGSLTRVELDGPLSLGQGANLTLLGVTQLPSGTPNSLSDASFVKVGDAPAAAAGQPSVPSALLGFNLGHFSDLSLTQSSQINGNLACGSGANAWCSNPANVSGTSSCLLCPKP
jgi:hypothetical protein